MVLNDSQELDYSKVWNDAFNPALATAATVITEDLVYLCPFEVIDLGEWRTLKFKFRYAATGIAWGFTFRTSLFKMMRGTGGTAGTYQSVGTLGIIAVAPPSATTGTVYVLVTVTTIASAPLESGTYALGMQWDDTSILGANVTFTAYGALLPSSNDCWYVDGGSSAGSMPTTIATIGNAQLFQPYWQQH